MAVAPWDDAVSVALGPLGLRRVAPEDTYRLRSGAMRRLGYGLAAWTFGCLGLLLLVVGLRQLVASPQGLGEGTLVALGLCATAFAGVVHGWRAGLGVGPRGVRHTGLVTREVPWSIVARVELGAFESGRPALIEAWSALLALERWGLHFLPAGASPDTDPWRQVGLDRGRYLPHGRLVARDGRVLQGFGPWFGWAATDALVAHALAAGVPVVTRPGGDPLGLPAFVNEVIVLGPGVARFVRGLRATAAGGLPLDRLLLLEASETLAAGRLLGEAVALADLAWRCPRGTPPDLTSHRAVDTLCRVVALLRDDPAEGAHLFDEGPDLPLERTFLAALARRRRGEPDPSRDDPRWRSVVVTGHARTLIGMLRDTPPPWASADATTLASHLDVGTPDDPVPPTRALWVLAWLVDLGLTGLAARWIADAARVHAGGNPTIEASLAIVALDHRPAAEAPEAHASVAERALSAAVERLGPAHVLSMTLRIRTAVLRHRARSTQQAPAFAADGEHDGPADLSALPDLLRATPSGAQRAQLAQVVREAVGLGLRRGSPWVGDLLDAAAAYASHPPDVLSLAAIGARLVDDLPPELVARLPSVLVQALEQAAEGAPSSEEAEASFAAHAWCQRLAVWWARGEVREALASVLLGPPVEVQPLRGWLERLVPALRVLVAEGRLEALAPWTRRLEAGAELATVGNAPSVLAAVRAALDALPADAWGDRDRALRAAEALERRQVLPPELELLPRLWAGIEALDRRQLDAAHSALDEVEEALAARPERPTELDLDTRVRVAVGRAWLALHEERPEVALAALAPWWTRDRDLPMRYRIEMRSAAVRARLRSMAGDAVEAWLAGLPDLPASDALVAGAEVAIGLAEEGRWTEAEGLLRRAHAGVGPPEDVEGEAKRAYALRVLLGLAVARRSRHLPEPTGVVPLPPEIDGRVGVLQEAARGPLWTLAASLEEDGAVPTVDELPVGPDPASVAREVLAGLVRAALVGRPVGGGDLLGAVGPLLDRGADLDVRGVEVVEHAVEVARLLGRAQVLLPAVEAAARACSAVEGALGPRVFRLGVAGALLHGADGLEGQPDRWRQLVACGELGHAVSPVLPPPALALAAALEGEQASGGAEVLAAALGRRGQRGVAERALRFAWVRALQRDHRLAEALAATGPLLRLARLATAGEEAQVRELRAELAMSLGRASEGYAELVEARALAQGHALWTGRTPAPEA